MTTIEQLKSTYNLKTGDELAPRPKPPEEHGQVRVRWSRDKKMAFKTMRPVALCIVATDGPVSVVTYDAHGQVKKRFGHNRGCWPMRVAVTSSWADNITDAYDKSPFDFTGVQIRVWLPTVYQRDGLALKVTDMLGAMATDAMGAELRKGWLDVGPEIDMAILEMEIHALAERLGFRVWDDGDLSSHLDRIVRRADELKKGGVR